MNKYDFAVLEVALRDLHMFVDSPKRLCKLAGVEWGKVFDFVVEATPLSNDEGARLIQVIHNACPAALFRGIDYIFRCYGSLDKTILIKSIYG